MEVSDAKKLRQLEDENGQLKTMVADLVLDNELLRHVNSRNGDARREAGAGRVYTQEAKRSAPVGPVDC